MTTEAVEVRSSILDAVEVKVPEAHRLKTKKYICGIRHLPDTKHLEFQIRIGPVCFASETFRWEGKGEHAKQVFREGAIYDLTDAQVEEIKAKIQYRYLRKYVKKGKNDERVVTGVADIDVSDGGAILVDDKGVQTHRNAQVLGGKLNGDETPLKNLIFMEPCYDNPKLGGRTVTVEDLRKMLEEAEREAARETSGDVTFEEMESGKGGKLEKKSLAGRAEPRDLGTAVKLSTTDGKRKAEGGYIPDQK